MTITATAMTTTKLIINNDSRLSKHMINEHTCLLTHIHTYTHIYRKRETERETQRERKRKHTF